MNTFVASAAILAALAGSAQAEPRNLSDFTSVSVSAGLRAEVDIGPSFGVDVSGRDAAQVVTRVESGRLLIHPERGWRWGGGRRDALVRITMPAVESLETSSGARIVAREINAANLELEASSGAEITIAGACAALSAEASSGARIAALELHCASGEVEASSGAQVSIFIDGVLSVDASSGANITVAGTPEMGDISLSSGGTLRRQGS